MSVLSGDSAVGVGKQRLLRGLDPESRWKSEGSASDLFISPRQVTELKTYKCGVKVDRKFGH